MAHDLTETGTFDATVEVPDDSDASVAASVEVGAQALANRTQYLLANLANGLLLGADLIRFDAAGAAYVSGFTVCIAGKLYTAASQSVPYTVAESPGLTGSGAAVAWWYLYCYVSAGALAFKWSLTGPDDSLTWRSDALGAQRYLGCAYSAASNSWLDARKVGGCYTLDSPVEFASGALSASGAWVTADLSTAQLLPPHGRYAVIGAVVENGNVSAPVDFMVRANGSTLSGAVRAVLTVPAAQTGAGTFAITTSAARAFTWSTTNDGSAGHPATLYLNEWRER